MPSKKRRHPKAPVLPSEEDIALVQQGKASAPVGTPRKASEVPLPKGTDAFGADVTGVAAQASSSPVAPVPSPTSAAAAASAAPTASIPRGTP